MGAVEAAATAAREDVEGLDGVVVEVAEAEALVARASQSAACEVVVEAVREAMGQALMVAAAAASELGAAVCQCCRSRGTPCSRNAGNDSVSRLRSTKLSTVQSSHRCDRELRTAHQAERQQSQSHQLQCWHSAWASHPIGRRDHRTSNLHNHNGRSALESTVIGTMKHSPQCGWDRTCKPHALGAIGVLRRMRSAHSHTCHGMSPLCKRGRTANC